MARFQAYHYAHHPDIAVDVIRPPRSLPVDIARSYLADQVIKSDYDFLWFVDQDCCFLPGTLERLMSRDVFIVGALCMMRGDEECLPMAYRGQNEAGDAWQVIAQVAHDTLRQYYDCSINAPQIVSEPFAGSLFEVDFTGCHCLLIKRGVLEAMKPPWFAGAPGQEDRYFCFKARDMGYRVSVDLSVLAGHATGDRTIGAFDFMAHAQLLNSIEQARQNIEKAKTDVKTED